MKINRTQITGLGPITPAGSRQIFDKEPKPFIATAEWLEAQTIEPKVGDYLDIFEDGHVVLVDEAEVSAAAAAPNDAEAQKKTDPAELDQQPKAQPQLQVGSGVSSETGLSQSLPVSYKYRGKPIEVEAYEIIDIGVVETVDGGLHLALSNGATVIAKREMLARITPQRGDYWVVQSDGYVYLNPKDVFERKYEKIAE